MCFENSFVPVIVVVMRESRFAFSELIMIMIQQVSIPKVSENAKQEAAVTHDRYSTKE